MKMNFNSAVLIVFALLSVSCTFGKQFAGGHSMDQAGTTDIYLKTKNVKFKYSSGKPVGVFDFSIVKTPGGYVATVHAEEIKTVRSQELSKQAVIRQTEVLEKGLEFIQKYGSKFAIP